MNVKIRNDKTLEEHLEAPCIRSLYLTCVEEESINESTVTEEGAHWCHIIKLAVTKSGVDEGDRLQLHIDESEEAQHNSFSDVFIYLQWILLVIWLALPVVDEEAIFVYLVL